MPLLLFCFAVSVIGSNIDGAFLYDNVKKVFRMSQNKLWLGGLTEFALWILSSPISETDSGLA